MVREIIRDRDGLEKTRKRPKTRELHLYRVHRLMAVFDGAYEMQFSIFWPVFAFSLYPSRSSIMFAYFTPL